MVCQYWRLYPTSIHKYEFGLVTASNKLEATNIAKSKWLIGCKKRHKDDISLEILISCYDCEVIKTIGNWEIELIQLKILMKRIIIRLVWLSKNRREIKI